jgi:hypothetical protein
MRMFKRKFRSLSSVFGCLTLACFLTGCSLTQMPSAGTDALHQDKPQPADQKIALLQDAFNKSTGIQKYGIKAFVTTTANNFTKNASFYGHVANPDRFQMNEVIDGKSFMVTQTAHETYLREDNKWKPIPRITKPFDLFGSLQRLSRSLAHVNQLKDDTVISTPTYVFQFDTDTNSVADLQNWSNVSAKDLQNVPVQITVWVGKSDHNIYKLKMQWSHDIPSIGNVAEDVTVMFFDLNSDVDIALPDGVGAGD